MGSVTDRRDYYHQFWTTDERSSLNAIHPVLKASQLEGLDAHQRYLDDFPIKRRKVGRLEGGDDLAQFWSAQMLQWWHALEHCSKAITWGSSLHATLMQDFCNIMDSYGPRQGCRVLLASLRIRRCKGWSLTTFLFCRRRASGPMRTTLCLRRLLV